MTSPLARSFICPVELSLEILAGKWKAIILAQLKKGPKTYGELRRLSPKMSDKMLTQRLAELTEHGLVAKAKTRDGASAPKPRGTRAVYELTTRGRSLRRLLEALNAWGKTVAPEVGARIQTLEKDGSRRGSLPSASRGRARSSGHVRRA